MTILNHSIIEKISVWIKSHFYDILLFIIIVLLMMLSFASGFITAKYQAKTPITIIEQPE